MDFMNEVLLCLATTCGGVRTDSQASEWVNQHLFECFIFSSLPFFGPCAFFFILFYFELSWLGFVAELIEIIFWQLHSFPCQYQYPATASVDGVDTGWLTFCFGPLCFCWHLSFLFWLRPLPPCQISLLIKLPAIINVSVSTFFNFQLPDTLTVNGILCLKCLFCWLEVDVRPTSKVFGWSRHIEIMIETLDQYMDGLGEL